MSQDTVEDRLESATYLILALVKLKQFAKAADELQQLGSLDSEEYVKEMPQGKVNVIPFAIRLMHAQLPQALGKPKVAIDLLYQLLDLCSRNGGQSLSNQVDGMQEDSRERKEEWNRRHETVIWCLINHHLLLGEFLVALQWLNWLLVNRRQDSKIWFAVACVQIMLGDPQAAKASSVHVSEKPLSELLKGLCDFSQGDYQGAASVFEASGRDKSVRSTVLTNKAICLVHLTDLPGATNTLTAGLHDQPLQTVDEHLISTLCTLYDLKGGFAGRESRNQLANFLNHFIPDDFDKSVLTT